MELTKHKNRSTLTIVLIICLWLNYLSDGVNKILEYHHAPFDRIGVFIRIFILIIALSFIFLKKIKLKDLMFIIVPLYLFIVFLIIESNSINNDSENDLLEQIIYFFKYINIFFLWVAFQKELSLDNIKQHFIPTFNKIFFFNGILAIIGLLFQWQLMASFFKVDYRFGYNGLINAQNEASYFYLLALFINYKQWREEKTGLWGILTTILLCFITGMKAVYLGTLILLIYHFITTITLKKMVFILTGILSFIVFIFIYIDKFIKPFAYFITQVKKFGIIYTLTGGRNTFLESRVLPLISKWQWYNYLFGGQNATRPNKSLALTEMAFLDLFLFFGIINGIIYFIFYNQIVFTWKWNKKVIIFILIILFNAFFAGHFFTSSLIPIYLLFIFRFLNTPWEKTSSLINR